jgi:isopentenyl diphosphate isomerase/L-lactate dehydrogenase-like FMN-dependent dehydrogenase
MEASSIARRDFLRYLAASPLLAGLGSLGALDALADGGEPLAESAAKALDVFELEAIAKKNLPPAHWGYMATGVDGDATVRANGEGFANLALRVRRLSGSRTPDTSVSLFGTAWETPIVLCPVSSQRAFHDDGEIATARAARAKKHLQILSTLSSASLEEVTAARSGPVWFQLYPTDQWSVAQGLMKRAEAAGAPALVLTVDLQYGSNRETVVRSRRLDTRDCSSCHAVDPFDFVGALPRRANYQGLDVSKVTWLFPPDATWDYVAKIRAAWPRKLLVKGIVTREDADLCLRHGVDGIVVSNHGGRAEESLRPSIDSLVEVVEAVKGRVPVILDGGIRRGTDIFKALARGATAVGIGRPQVWGLAAFGQAGVEAALDILRRELTLVMRQAGATNLSRIDRSYVVDRRTR